MMSSWPVWLFAPTSRYLSKRNAKLHSRHNRWNSLCVRNDKYRTSTKDFPTPNGPSTLTLVYPRCWEKLLSCWSRFEAARNNLQQNTARVITYIQAASQLALVTLLSLLKFHKRSQVVHRRSYRSPGENVTLVWPQEHLSCPWFCWYNLHFAVVDCRHKTGSKMSLCACNPPPVVVSKTVALCNPYLWAAPGGVIHGHRESAQKLQSWALMVGRLLSTIPGSQGIVWSYTIIEMVCHFWWFMAPCPGIQLVTIYRAHSFIRLSAGDWVACFIELRRLPDSPGSLSILIQIVYPEFWVCLALSGVHRLHHLLLPWHMPTKGPWAYEDSACCGTGDLKTRGLIGLEPNRLLVIRIGS